VTGPPARDPRLADLAVLDSVDTVIDVRSPGEFAEDHIPGAINLPVLDDAERARVGTLHKQASAFEARKLGAALVSRNIAHIVETHCLDKPRDWRPLVVCWRGGGRSGALTTVLAAIGFRVLRLEGGYKAYRRAVMDDLAAWPARINFRVVCGPTGSGKSRLLIALKETGAQVLDLEVLANHRGSVLGDLPALPQPSQKGFESLIWQELRGFDPKHPVFVEAESKKIGAVQIPDALIAAMRASACVALDTALPARVALLMEDYRHFFAAPALLADKLRCLTALHGHATLDRWLALIERRDWPALVEDLLVNHYDPAYGRSAPRNYAGLAQAAAVPLADATQAAFERLARCFAELP
jgi:tRNA 2-selenouridine synthase